MLVGIVVWGLMLGSGMAFWPQTYTATTSVSMQQPSSTGSSPLAAFGIAGGGSSRKYIGVLKSRRFAESAERLAHIQELYHLRTPEKAIQIIQKGFRADDNVADGLLYINVSLEGPPRLGLSDDPPREKVRQMSAQLANIYARILRNYLIDSDTDKDLALLREAEKEVRSVKKKYDKTLNQWIDFITQQKGGTRLPGNSTSDTGGDSLSPVSIAPQLQELKSHSIVLKEQITLLDTTLNQMQTLTRKSPEQLAAIPSEDPVLSIARARYNQEILEMRFLQSQDMVDTNPRVVLQRRRVKIAESQLKAQIASIQKGNTSDYIRRQALQAELDLVEQQIVQAIRDMKTNRSLGTEFEKRRKEVEFIGDTLKTAYTQYETLKLQTVSAQNRMSVIDLALPPETSKPGYLMLSAIAFFGTFGIIFLWLLIVYLRQILKGNRSPQAGVTPPVSAH